MNHYRFFLPIIEIPAILILILILPTYSSDDENISPVSADSLSRAEAIEAVMSLSLKDLLELTVYTTSKSEERISEAPGVISVVTTKEINRFGARTLKDILMRMPSINLSTMYMTDRSCVSIRGDQINAAANHILLLINGRPVREADEGGIKGEVLESFPVSIIDRIEIVRGPGSVLYGSNAFSGVINVITRKPADDKTSITAQGGYPGNAKVTASAAYQLGPAGLVVGGQYRYEKPWEVEYQATATEFRNFTIPNNGIGTYAELSVAGLKLMTSYNQWQNFFAMQKYIPPPPVGSPAPMAGMDCFGNGVWQKWFNDIGYSHTFSDKWDMSINGTFTNSWLTIDSFPAPHRNSFDLTGEWTNFIHPVENMNIIAGILGNFVKGKEESGVPGNLGTTLDTTQGAFSGYVQGDYRFLSQFKVIAGVQANKAAGIDFDVNPRLGMIWTPADVVNVKALYSNAFRAPSMMELYLSHPTLMGKSDLKPEKVRTVDLGVNVQSENASFGINTFYSEITNTIYPKQNIPPPNEYNNQNIPTTFVGVEVEGKVYFTKELMLIGSGLYQKNTNGDSIGNMMPVPEASAKGGISYSANGFTASVFNIYEGALHPRYNATYNKTREAFSILNATLKYEISRAFKLEVPVITLDVEGYNLLDEEIWLPPTGLARNYTGPEIQGFSFYCGVTVGF